MSEAEDNDKQIKNLEGLIAARRAQLPFVTCEAGAGYVVKITCNSLQQAHEYHDAVLKIVEEKHG